MSESPNGQPAEGAIVDCRGGDGNAAVHQPPEASYAGKLIYLWDTWEMTKALAAIAALNASLLRPLFAPLLDNLKTTLRRAVDSMRDMEATELLHDEILHASLEYELFDAWKLTRALEMFRESSGARLSSLFAPLLDNLETTLRRALDVIDELDAPLHGGPAATPPATNGRATEVLAPQTPADHFELVAAPTSGDGAAATEAATNGRAPEALTVNGCVLPFQRTHPLLKVPTGRVYVVDKDGLGEEPVDLDGCRIYRLADPAIDGGDECLNIYYTKDCRWIQHRDMVSFDNDSPEGLNEMLAETSPSEAARLIAEWTDGYLPQDLEPYRESVTSSATNCPALEAPTARPLVILGEPGDQPIVNGKIKPRLTLARYHIIDTLIDAAEKGLTGDELVNKSGHGGAVNTLKAMARDRDWGAAIQLPGSPGSRYRIVSKLDGH